MFQAGVVSSADIILVSMIYSFSKGRHGCFASNEYLGSQLGVSPRHIQKMVQNLVSLRVLVRQETENNGRIIWTAFNDIKSWHKPRPTGRGPRPTGRADHGLQGVPFPSKEGTISKVYTASHRAERSSDAGFVMGSTSKKTFYQKCASKLERALREKRKFEPVSKVASWPSVFEKLVHSDQMDRARVKRVLVWYLENIGKPYVPAAYSAKSFAANFVRIESCMERAAEKRAKESPEVFEMNDVVLESFNRSGAADLGWPGASKAQLPRLYQESWDALEDAHRRCRRMVRQLEAWGEAHPELWKPAKYHAKWRVHRFAQRLLSGPLSSPEFALTRYLSEVARQLSRWPSWSGDLAQFTWALENRRVTKQLQQESIAECGNADVAGLFLEQIADIK
jgi:hypothetical protein